jgi:filamentous hemagglutinin
VLGGLQAVGGAVDMAAGYMACMTGAGCLAGGAMVAYGADQYQAGANTSWYGTPYPTVGGYLLQQAGVSAQTAEALYGVLGMSPAAIQAIKANKVVDAWVASNAAARGSYVTTGPGVANAVADAEAGTSVAIANQTNTGRYVPNNLNEQIAMQQVVSNPAAGQELRVPMTDPRWPASDGWVKMAQNVNGVEVHYVRNTNTGAVADFKFK